MEKLLFSHEWGLGLSFTNMVPHRSYRKLTAFHCFPKPQGLIGSNYLINLILGQREREIYTHTGDKYNHGEKK